MMLAQLVTEEAVSKRLESERPGVKGFRRRAAEEILDHSFESLSKNETGRLKLEYLRGRRRTRKKALHTRGKRGSGWSC